MSNLDRRDGTMRRLLGAVAVAATVAGLPVAHVIAQSAPFEQTEQVSALAEALHLEALIDVMRAEGLAYGDTIASDLFDGTPPADWDEGVSGIYDAGRMKAVVSAALVEALEGDDVAAMIEFMNDGPGARAAAFELSAREARLDPAIESAADEAAALALADEDPRMDLITRYIAANDLIERNLADAMTSNYAFYMGLMDGGALPEGVGETEILQDVWGQAPLIRQNLSEWYYSYLYMAFAPLEDEEIEAYIAFSQTTAGQQLNDALFQAFDAAFVDISRALGRGAADLLLTQEL